VSAAASLTQWLDVSQGGAGRVMGVLLVHQLVVIGSVALRAAWYARALRLMATSS
jgi:hypothetical protein